MYIESVPNRNSPPAVLLRESYRQHGKVQKRTLLNLSHWPPALVAGLRVLLKGGTAVPRLDEAFDIVRSRSHGAVAAVLGTLQRLGIERLIDPQPSPQRDRVLALIVARVLQPGSQLDTAHSLAAAHDTLAEILGLGALDEDELDDAVDWLLERQQLLERELVRQHLQEGMLVLYDLTSVYLGGRHCPLAKGGYSHDGKRGKLQMEFGLLCTAQGCPVAVEVFAGNTADPCTVGVQIEKLRARFGLQRVVLVGDRGMLAEARIRDEVQAAGLDWITALRGPAIRRLVDSGTLQLSLFDDRDWVEVHSDAYPGERLLVCRNPLLAEERARKREELLAATEQLLAAIVSATQRQKWPLQGAAEIGKRVGRDIGQYKMAKHFAWEIDEHGVFSYRRKEEAIAAEAALDGLYVIRTSLPASALDSTGTVRAYKRLGTVEQAFLSLKTVDLKAHPVFQRRAERVRAHVLLCMLAYYVESHMRQRLAPLLCDDEDPASAEAAPVSGADPARVSAAARNKAGRKRNAAGQPVHSFRTLLADLATLTRNHVVPRLPDATPFDLLARPTELQREAFRLLSLRLQ